MLQFMVGKIDPETDEIQDFLESKLSNDRDADIAHVFEPGEYLIYCEIDWK
jgi:hypothetical protein